MKKIIVAILTVVICIIFITGCDYDIAEAETTFRFDVEHELMDYHGNIRTITDQETGVMYLFVDDDKYGAGITVMVDKDGKPLINNKYLVE